MAGFKPQSWSVPRARLRAASLGLCLALLALATAAAPAGAVVARIGGRSYGVTPVRGANLAQLPAATRALSSPARSLSAPLPYDKAGQLISHGGPVMHSVTTHLIYWDPNSEFTATTTGIFSRFFTDVAHDSGSPTNVFAVAGQYTDSTGHAAYSSSFAAAKLDKDAYPTTKNCTTPKGPFADPGPYSRCLYDEQLQKELATYIAAEGLPTGPTQLYFMLLPHKVVSCFPEEDPEIKERACSNNVFCAYHSSFGPSEEVIYATIPFSLLDSEGVKGCQSDGNPVPQLPNGDAGGTNEATRFADVALKYTSHEYIEAATDPFGDGWWENANGQEIGDKCNFAGSGSSPGEDRNAFLPTLGGSAESGTLFNQAINGEHFYLQSEWDNVATACRMQPLGLSGVRFTASQSAGLAGTPVTFSATATDPYGAPKLTWNFGDGAEAVGSAPEHVYGAAGTYEVTVTASDPLTGATAPPIVQSFLVSAPPAPTPPAAPVVPPATPEASATAPVPASVVAVAAPAGNVALPSPTSAFTSSARVSTKTGALTLTLTVVDPGTLSWLATFQNGGFGVFAASVGKCRKGFVRLGGKCRPAKIVFARGHTAVARAGGVTIVLQPSASGAKALRNALNKRKGLPVSVTLTFKSSRGAGAVSHSTLLSVRLQAH
jgi:hypothetical protein